MYNYDAQIAKLTEHPEWILQDWMQAVGLFSWTGDIIDGFGGCILTIRTSPREMVIVKGKINKELSQAIKEDNRFPAKPDEIKVEHLLIFKEWKLKIDALCE